MSIISMETDLQHAFRIILYDHLYGYKRYYLYSHSSHWYGCSSVLWCSTWWAAVLGSGHLSHSSSLDLLMEAIVVALGHFPRPLCTICSWVNEWVLKSQLSHLNGFSPLCLFRWYSILLHDWNTCNQKKQHFLKVTCHEIASRLKKNKRPDEYLNSKDEQ